MSLSFSSPKILETLKPDFPLVRSSRDLAMGGSTNKGFLADPKILGLEFRWKSNGYVGGNLKRLAVYVYFFHIRILNGYGKCHERENLFLSRAILNLSKKF